MPEAPEETTSADETLTRPLPELDELPLSTDNAPPAATPVEEPAATNVGAPEVAELPGRTDKEPAVPDEEAPELTRTLPDLPEAVCPVLISTSPLLPEPEELAVEMLTAPLPSRELPAPLVTIMLPPLAP